MSRGERLSREHERAEKEVRRVLRDAPKALTAPEGLRSAGHRVLRELRYALGDYGDADDRWLRWKKERQRGLR